MMGQRNSGKTTLIRLLWGFVAPTAGKVSVLGLAPYLHQVEVRRRAGFVPESAVMYEWLSVLEMLDFVSRFYPKWDHDHAMTLLRALAVDPACKVFQLSPSDQFKVRLVAALGHRPALLLLDSPFQSLDNQAQLEIHTFLKRLSREENVAMVITSLVNDQLDRLADTMLMLDRGAVIEQAPAAVLKEKFGVSSMEEVFLEVSAKVLQRRHGANA